MGTLQRMIKRLQNILGRDLRESNLEKKEVDTTIRERTGSRINGSSSDPSRVLYHYPKQGEFRFPLRVDENEEKRVSRESFRVREDKKNVEDELLHSKKIAKSIQEAVEKKEENWFTSRDFKRTEIPSQIYGLKGRPQRKTEFENDSNQIISEIEKINIQQKESEPELIDEYYREPEIEEDEPIKQFNTENELNVVKHFVDDQIIVEEEPSQTDPGLIVEEESSQIDPGLIVEEESSQTDPGLIVEEESSQTDPGLIVEEEPSQTDPALIVEEKPSQTDHVLIVEEDDLLEQENQKPKTIKTTTPVGKRGKKQNVPFNVIMLPQDRAKYKKSIKEQSTGQSAYEFPSIQLLDYPAVQQEDESEWLAEQAEILEESLQSFHVDAKVVHVTKGPSVTRFEIQPGRGVKVNKVTGLTDDIKLALSAKDIRIEAPIPGKNTIGIEVPNRKSTPVFLREILRRDVFVRSESPLTVALGLDISGQPIVTDLMKMPHGLVAGATGSGKSVCINSVLISLLYKASPDEVKLMLIDPKMVELAPYNGVPHLVTPVITDAKQATAALKWVVQEMERRYELFSQQGVRDVGRYNTLYSDSPDQPALPYILVVIDELADLMMISPQDVEDSICRIAQKARACGIHLLLATQRPSVDVITGLIKANIPTRIAFTVSSQVDSRTILDMGGAERLLGRGDMLFHENGMPKPVRVQGTFVSDEEIENVIAHVKKQREPQYLLETEQLQRVSVSEADDEYFEEACYFVIEQGSASASSLQRRFRVGYNRAARLIDLMEERGIISEAMGSKPRHVLVDEIGFEELLYHTET